MTPERLAEIRRAMACAAKVIDGPTLAGELLVEVDRLRDRIAEMELDAEMSCVEPADNCQCSGCMRAAELRGEQC